MRMRGQSLASLMGWGSGSAMSCGVVADVARIPRCCGCGGEEPLQLHFDPEPGNFHMPSRCSPKNQKRKKKSKMSSYWSNMMDA